jgi:hypothetical protein
MATFSYSLTCAIVVVWLSAGLAQADEGCEASIAAAERQNHLPAGILHAIGVVESGRRDPLTGRSGAWPFSVNAAGETRFFGAMQPAVAYVKDALAHGIRSIDVGCMQVNLMYHPGAFASLEQAFVPEANVRYAAAFLMDLYQDTGDWITATGRYHSSTPSLSREYAQRVQAVMRGQDADDVPWMRPVMTVPSIILASAAVRQPRVIGPYTPQDRLAGPGPARRLPVVYHP